MNTTKKHCAPLITPTPKQAEWIAGRYYKYLRDLDALVSDLHIDYITDCMNVTGFEISEDATAEQTAAIYSAFDTSVLKPIEDNTMMYD